MYNLYGTAPASTFFGWVIWDQISTRYADWKSANWKKNVRRRKNVNWKKNRHDSNSANLYKKVESFKQSELSELVKPGKLDVVMEDIAEDERLNHIKNNNNTKPSNFINIFNF